MRNLFIFLCLIFSQVVLASDLPYNTNGWVDDPQARREYQQSAEHQLLRSKFVKVASLYKNEEGSALLYRALYQLKKELGQLSDLEKQTGRLDAENQRSLGSCFMRDALVTMADGSQKEIGDIVLGDKVLTAEGNFGTVYQLMMRPYDGRMIRLKLWGHSGIEMTEEHPVLTKRGYVRANELQLTDMVALPRRKFLDKNDKLLTGNHINKRKYVNSEKITEKRLAGNAKTNTEKNFIFIKQLPEEFEKNYQFGYIIGSFLAEGCTSSGKAIWTWNINEEDTHVQTLVDALESHDLDWAKQYRGKSNTIKINVHSTAFAMLMESLCGRGSNLKNPHKDISNGSKEYLEGLYRGWMDGDGHARRGTEYGTTVSKKLAFFMMSLDLALGNNSTVSTQKGRASHGVKSRFDSYQVGHADSNKETWRCESTDTHIWRKVRKIEDFHYKGMVYNMEVKGDHSYTISCIGVHNCVGFGSGSAIDQRGAVMAYSRSVWSQNNRWVGLVAKGHIYALSRIGHGGFGDGSTGSWMAKSIANHGIPFRSQKAGSYDFNDYNIGLIRSWTRSGSVPQEVRDKASEYKGRAVLVEDTEEARVALQRGFPIYICSQSSFRTTRDSQGVSPRTGRAWAHCMNVCAYIDELDAFVILNSWGPDRAYGGWIGGPVGFLEDLPQGAFICSRRDMEYILKQGDSYCIAELDTLVNLINWKDVITGFKGVKR